MKLKYKPIVKDSRSSIYVQRIYQPYVEGNWHFHQEFELIYFLKGQGMRIVGDHISNFKEGELVLVGQWLPHLWRNDVDLEKNDHPDFIVVKFRDALQGVNIFSLPELAGIKRLLKTAKQGIKFSSSIHVKVHTPLIKLSKSRSIDKLIYFLKILQILSYEKDFQLLSSPGFILPAQISGENRLQKVINYISENYSKSISLEEIAGVTCMTPPAFCRFFKTRTNKTFSVFLNEVKVSKACQLLINGEKSIHQICYEAGFRSLTNFNRTFRTYKRMTPTAYRANYHTFQ